MPKSILIILFFLCSIGLFWGASSDDTEEYAVQTTLFSKLPSIPDSYIRLGLRIFAYAFDKMMTMLRPLFESMKPVIADLLGYLASSDDTALVRTRRDIQEYSRYSGYRSRSMPSIFGTVFTYPFKVAMNTARIIPFNSLYDGMAKLIEPVGVIAKSSAVESVTNATMEVANNLAAQAWNFTKSSVLPRVDRTITQLKKSETLPDGVVRYLNDVQSIYRILRMFNIL